MTSITNEYVKSKQKPRYAKPQAEKQASLFSAARPDRGPRCKHTDCRKTLMSYEVELGECLSHIKERNRTWHKERVMLADTPTRTRTRGNYQKRGAVRTTA